MFVDVSSLRRFQIVPLEYLATGYALFACSAILLLAFFRKADFEATVKLDDFSGAKNLVLKKLKSSECTIL
jgi:hypothetical protein